MSRNPLPLSVSTAASARARVRIKANDRRVLSRHEMPPGSGLRRSTRGVDRIESREHERHVVGSPSVIGLREQRLRRALGFGLGGERRRDRLVRHHLRQSVRTQQQAIAGLDFERVGFDVDAELLAADDVRDDMAETVPGDLVGLKGSAAHHVGHQRVVMR